MNRESGNAIILFDGLCNLCEGSVQLVLKNDSKRRFQFASLQSPVAEKLLQEFPGSSAIADSFVLIENGRLYTRSTAALRVCWHLNGLFPLLYGFMIVPRFIRDAVYKLIARNRYKWFGRKNECWLPSPEVKNRFLDQNDLRQTELPAG